MLNPIESAALETSRPHTISSYKQFKVAFGQILSSCGGATNLSGITRVGQSALYQMASTNEAKHFPPVDVVADLEQVAGDPVVTRVLARLSGYTLTPIREVACVGSISLVLAKLGKEVSEVFSSAAQSLEDEKLCPREAQVVLRDVDEAMAVLEVLRGKLKATADLERSAFHALMTEAA